MDYRKYLSKLKGKKLTKALLTSTLGIAIAIPGVFYLTKDAKATLSTDSVGTYEAKTVADFTQWCGNSNGYVNTVDRGGVQLRPWRSAYDFEFNNNSSNSYWTAGAYTTGGSFTPTFTNGNIVLNDTDGAYYLSNTSSSSWKYLEFRAEFDSGDNQDVGFADSKNFNSYLVFSTKTNGELNARIKNAGSVLLDINLGTSYFNTYHTYKIVRNDNRNAPPIKHQFLIDNVVVAEYDSGSTYLNDTVKPILSNNSQSTTVEMNIDWLTAFSNASGAGANNEYVSCAIDSGTDNTSWGTLNFSSNREDISYSTYRFETRTWNHGGSASAYLPVFNREKVGSPKGRYLEYRIFLGASSNNTSLPYISNVKINYIKTTSANTSTKYSTTFSDFEQTCATKSNAKVTVDRGIENLPYSDSANANTINNGEIRFNPNYMPFTDTTFRDDFESTISSTLWTRGNYVSTSSDGLTVQDGKVKLYRNIIDDGHYLLSNSSFNKRVLSFRAKFSYHHQRIGFANDKDYSTFIGFSTENNLSVNAVINSQKYNLGLGLIDSISSNTDNYHDYRIEWGDNIKFYVDERLVVADSSNITTSLKPLIASKSYYQYTANPVMKVEYLSIDSPKSPLTEYVSCALDSGVSNTLWGAAHINSTTAENVTFAISTRTSNDSLTWTSWSGINSNNVITSPVGRYLQYKIYLTGSYTNSTSTLDDIMISYLNP